LDHFIILLECVGYIAHSDRMMCELLIGTDVEGTGHGFIQCAVPAFSKKN